MQLAAEKNLPVIRGDRRLPKIRGAVGMIFRKTSKHNYLDSIITDTDATVNENIIKAKSKLIQMCPFLRLSGLSIPIRAKSVELFMDPTAAYGLSTTVL